MELPNRAGVVRVSLFVKRLGLSLQTFNKRVAGFLSL